MPAPREREGRTLSSPSPALPLPAALDLAGGGFGVACDRAEILTAERDQNILLTAGGGRRYVMKVSNPDEDREVTDLQTAALCHVEATAPGLPTPRIRRTRDGHAELDVVLPDGRKTIVRLLSYIEGRPLHQSPPSGAQRRSLARHLARLDASLAGFQHPGQRQYLQWDSSNLDRLEDLVPGVEDGEARDWVADVLAEFKDGKAALSALRRQVIYNDLNPFNVLVDAERPDVIAGIIDFGDIVEAPLVNDVAVALSYRFAPGGGRGEAAEFLAAYHDALPLLDAELDLLPLLVCGRAALTLLITSYRARRYPDNRAYILRNAGAARRALAELRSRSSRANVAWVRASAGADG